MRIMRFTILSLLMLAIAIPAAATTCSICILETYVNADGTSQVTSASCDPSPAGDIPDCLASRMGGNAECDSVSLVAACGEGGGVNPDGCPPWGCIQYVKAPRVHSMRPRRHSTV